MNPLKKLGADQIEIKFCSGREVSPLDSNDLVYLQRMLGADYRKAQAIAMTEELNPLQKIRTAIARGDLKQAQQILLNLGQMDSSWDAEVLLEKARLAFLSGNWEQTIPLATAAMESDPSGVTQMTLFQVRSAGHYELGNFVACKSDIEKVLILARIYPRPSLVRFAQVTLNQISAIQGKGFDWNSHYQLIRQTDREKNFNLDTLLAFLRSELTILRSLSNNNKFLASDEKTIRQARSLALLCYRSAEILGDDLYQSLAALDCQALGFAMDESEIKMADFPRIARISDEVTSLAGSFKSTSARLISGIQVKETDIQPPRKISHLIHLGSQLIFTLDPFEVRSVKISESTALALQGICGGPVSLSDFFRLNWNMKYAEHLHQNLIYKKISRLRKETGFSILIENKMIRLESSVLVLEKFQ